MHEKTNFSN
uniref:Uncharacterized protein n=1 Tax=Rhizophora mucronata TaxID=61149 RepID=A0A2P2QAE0_RHIMU